MYYGNLKTLKKKKIEHFLTESQEEYQSDNSSNKSSCSEEVKLQEETWERKNLKRKPGRTSFLKRSSRKISFNKKMRKAQIQSKETSEQLEAERNVAFISFQENIIENHSFNIDGPLKMHEEIKKH